MPTIALHPVATSWQQRLHDGPLQEAIALHLAARRSPALAGVAAGLETLITSLRGLLGDTAAVEPEEAREEGSEVLARIVQLAKNCPYAHVSVQNLLPGRVVLTPGAATLAVRVINEALANLRHTDATRAIVTLDADGTALWVSVADDGGGFDVAKALAPRPGHFGLRALREDLAEVGCRLRIRTIPGRGSRIQVELPTALRPSERDSDMRISA